jgi:hypothetical protein
MNNILLSYTITLSDGWVGGFLGHRISINHEVAKLGVWRGR